MIKVRIPADFGPEFLAWLKLATEHAWRGVPSLSTEDSTRCGMLGCSWQRDTRWTEGLADAEVAALEMRFGVRFPASHRLFLTSLHATTPARRCTAFIGNVLHATERPGFYHWQRDEDAIHHAMDKVVNGLIVGVEQHGLWLGTWGTRPATAADRSAHIAELVAAAPRLIPMIGHRYVLADVEPSTVLSVHRSDILVYGSDLRGFLLHELCDLLGIARSDTWLHADTRAIPFWGELIG